jgi:acetyl-CoA synthetase
MADTPASTGRISALLQESRKFPPSPAFTAAANAKPEMFERAKVDPMAFWAEAAKGIDWYKPWTQLLEWDVPWAKWFVDGELNASYNCVDRHLTDGRKTKAAIIWEGEPGEERVLTYQDLYREVNRAAHALRALGVKKGPRR